MLADGLRNHDPNAESRVELMSGGEVLGFALLTWLRNTEDEIEVARRVVKAVWPRVCTKRSQTHPGWAASCEIKMDLVTEIESRIRTNSERPISSASNITICNKYSGRSWRWGGQGSAGQGRLAGTSAFVSTVGQSQQDNGRRQHPSAGLQ